MESGSPGREAVGAGLVTLHPMVPAGVGPIFFVHNLPGQRALAYSRFSKLMHMGGVFLSPTRNMMNNNRMERYVNPGITLSRSTRTPSTRTTSGRR